MSICIISPEASQDLERIFEYFASRNVDAGERFVLAFEKKCQNLVKFPQMGRAYSEIELSLRGVALDNYIIFYRPIDEGVEIVRVVSGYQNLSTVFEQT